jgi:hypothetical protein
LSYAVLSRDLEFGAPIERLALSAWRVETILFPESSSNGNRDWPIKRIEDLALQVHVTITIVGLLKL